MIVLATIAAALLMAFGGLAAQAAGSAPAAAVHQASEEKGLVIVSVDPDGPAAAAGVKRGDILLEVDGQQTDRARDLLRVISSLEADAAIQVRVLHGDDERLLDLTVGERNSQAYLGLQPYFGGGMAAARVELPEAAAENAAGALITEVVADSPAEAAGLEVGDVVTAVAGKALDETGDLATAIGEYQPGDEITLEIAKPGADDERTELSVTLGENPDQADKALLGVRYRPALAAPMLDDRLMPVKPGESPAPEGRLPGRDRFPFFRDFTPSTTPNALTGAAVESVVKDSPAEAAGLQEGDVITAFDGTAVAGPQDVVDAVAAKKPGDSVTLTVEREGADEPLSVDVTLGEHPDKAGKAYLGVTIGAVFMQMQSGDGSSNSRFFNFDLPFDLENLPFDLDKLPVPFDFEPSAPTGQEPA
jgi:S1-C subfamily serine protease